MVLLSALVGSLILVVTCTWWILRQLILRLPSDSTRLPYADRSFCLYVPV